MKNFLKSNLILVGSVLLLGLFVPNNAWAVPTVSGVSVSPSSPTTDNDLTAEYTLGGTATHARVNWIKDGTSITNLFLPFESNNGSESSATDDLSGYNNDGTVNGATWSSTSGHDSRGAYDFDGSLDYITLSDSASLSITGEISVEFWANFDNPANHETIISNYDAGGGERSYRVETSNGFCDANEITFSVSSQTSTFTGGTLCSDAVLTAGWHHVVVTFVPSVSMDIYIDGVNRTDNYGSGSQPTGIADSDRDLAIGGGYNNSATPNDRFFNGNVDEIRIYPTALSSSQITDLYNDDGERISTDETEVGEEWQVTVFASDATETSGGTTASAVTIGASTAPVPEFSDYVFMFVIASLVYYVFRHQKKLALGKS